VPERGWFLVSPKGDVVARFGPKMTPDDPAVIAAIEKQLPFPG